MPVDTQPPPPRAVQTVIWLALTAATLVYVIVAFVVRAGEIPGVSLPDLSQPLELVLTIAALVAIVAGFAVPRLSGAGLARHLEPMRVASEDERARAVQPVLISRWAMFESVAIYGFVIVMAGAPASRIIPFSAVAAALLLAHPPSKQHIDALLGE